MKLKHIVVIHIPSRDRDNKTVDNTEQLIGIKKAFIDFFGGFNCVESVGGWVTDKGLVIEEGIIKVMAYSDGKNLNKHKDDLLTLYNWLKDSLRQEVISLEIDNELSFI